MREPWAVYFMRITKDVAKRSQDPKTKVGAVLVKNNRIVSTGYNGLPAGMTLPDSIWFSESKHLYVLHAELNAIVYANRDDTDGATLYVTHSPCRDCVKVIAAAKIKDVVFDQVYDEKALPLLEAMGVKYKYYSEIVNETGYEVH